MRPDASARASMDRSAACSGASRPGAAASIASATARVALVRAGRGGFRVRWMTSREYARLQGAPGFAIPAGVTGNQALSGFGDAVCVPAAEWAARRCLAPVFGARPPAAPDGGAPARPAA